MTNRRRNRSLSADHAPRARETLGTPEMTALLVSLVFLLGLCVYSVLFYRSQVAPGIYAYQRLAYVLLPDQVLESWCGGEFGRVAVSDRVGPLVVVLVIGNIAACLGWLILDLLRVRPLLDHLEVGVLATGLGLSGLSLFTLAIGLLGGLQQPIWFTLFALALVLAMAWRVWQSRLWNGMVRRERSKGEQAIRARDCPWRSVRWWWAAVPFGCVLWAGAVLPPVDFDVLEYHLQVPKEWYQQGHVSFLPHNVYGNMPLGGEMLALQAMALMPGELAWWWGALSGKLAMAIYPLLTTALLLAAGRRWYSQRAGVIAALIYISTAWVAKVALAGLNENAVAFFLFASFFVGRVWWDVRSSGERSSWGLVALTGLLAGSAVSCKYTSLLLVVLPLVVVVFWAGRRMRVRAVLVFALCTTAACGLWLGKNWIQAGNPTYPLLVHVFGGNTRTLEKDAQWRRAHQVPRDAAGRRYSFAQAGAGVADVLWGSCWQNPLIVPCAVLLVLRRRQNRDIVYWASLLAFVLLAWWLATHRLTRFWVPVIPLMALLAGVGATWSTTVIWRRTMTAVLVFGLAANFVCIVTPGMADNRFLVSLEQLRDDVRLDFGVHRPIAFHYLSEHVPRGSQVLVVGDAAIFNLRVPALYNTCFDDCVFETLFRDHDARERRARLQELGISHIYIDWAELRRYRQPGNYGYSPYITPALVQGELVLQQQLLRRVDVPGLDSSLGEVFAVVPVGGG